MVISAQNFTAAEGFSRGLRQGDVLGRVMSSNQGDVASMVSVTMLRG